jgi:cytochrome P450
MPDFPHASLLEGVRFTAQVAVPNVIQGLFRRRRSAVALATKAGADGLAAGFMAGLKRSYGEGPVWIRVAKDEALLLLGRGAIRHALEGSPDPFAADPEPKRSAMAKFQPDALTISRGEDWEDRRRFTEAVLDTHKPVHRLGDRFAEVCAEETAGLSAHSTLDFDAFNRAIRRITRRVILGDAAADDDELSDMLGELMDKSNPPGGGDQALYERYMAALRSYVEAAEAGSVVGLFSDAPVTARTRPAGQVTHWLFALGDTLAINAFRCLALLAVFDRERQRVVSEAAKAELRSGAGVAGMSYLGACLQEAMRLWPTTPMLSREAVRDVDWNGVPIRKGTQLLIVNAFTHRDREEFSFADRFDPEQWVSGEAAQEFSFNQFSHGPQGCPGTALALFVGKAVLGGLLRAFEARLVEPQLEPQKPLPYSLDYFTLRFALKAR